MQIGLAKIVVFIGPELFDALRFGSDGDPDGVLFKR